MKKLILIIIFGLFYSPVFAGDSIKLVYFDNFKPYSWHDNNNQMRGILVDALTEALQQRMGIDVVHKGYRSWAQAQEMVRQGRADAFATVPTPQRREYTKISSVPIIITRVTIFTNKGNPQIKELEKVKSISDLAGYKMLNYKGNGWAKVHLKGFDITQYDDQDSVLKNLTNNGLFLHGSIITNNAIKRLGLTNRIIEIPVNLDSASINLCIGKKSVFINNIMEFDKTLKKMSADGTLQDIINKNK